MARIQSIPGVVFVVTATAVAAFLYAANYIFPGPLYWPGLLVALPAIPFIILTALISESLQPFAFCVFPGIFWGIFAAGIAFLIVRKKRD